MGCNSRFAGFRCSFGMVSGRFSNSSAPHLFASGRTIMRAPARAAHLRVQVAESSRFNVPGSGHVPKATRQTSWLPSPWTGRLRMKMVRAATGYCSSGNGIVEISLRLFHQSLQNATYGRIAYRCAEYKEEKPYLPACCRGEIPLRFAPSPACFQLAVQADGLIEGE
jgi:hypothetical protein